MEPALADMIATINNDKSKSIFFMFNLGLKV